MPEAIALLNPAARRSKPLRLLEQQLATYAKTCDLIHCASSTDLECRARTAAQQNIKTIIAIGGDGTIHHVANGILHAENSTSALGVIASGSANDYWATLMTYAGTNSGGELLVDVGEIHYAGLQRYFVNVLGIGFSAETAAAAQHYKKWPSRLRYLLGVFEALRSHWSLTKTHFQLDGGNAREANVLLLSIAKGRREGSFTLAPDARLDDGRFQIVLAHDLRRRDICRYLPGVSFGKLPKGDARIRFESAHRVTLQPASPLRYHLDGELFGESRFESNCKVEIRVHPKRLRVRFLQARS
jgi:diacylglycerol kinase (ATP)